MADNTVTSDKFFITREVWNKVINYAKAAYEEFKCEIGGMLVMLPDDEGDFILQDPVILKQEITGGNCVLDEASLAVYYSKYSHKYDGQSPRFVWWHSHHTMGAFWSSTDSATIEKTKTQDFTVSLVVNLKEEYKLRVQYFNPIECYANTELNFLGEPKSKIPEEVTKEVKELCTEPVNTWKSKRTGEQIALYGHGSYTQNYDSSGYDTYDDWPVYDHIEEQQKRLLIGKMPDNMYELIIDKIDEMNSSFLAGTLTYKSWSATVITINTQLKPYELMLEKLSVRQLNNVVNYRYPEDYLKPVQEVELVK
tara:strand:- start:6009 stop:6935 length:927 start_codon:yes stop_codon:yes gene_type:complete